MADPTPVPGDPARPRQDSWGGPEARRALRQIAEDIRARAGFTVCAIEVLRNDDMLEFVAITGSPEGEAELLGTASPLNVMGVAFSLGAEYGALTFVAQEWFTDEAAERMATYGWVPDLPTSDDPGQWQPMDMLVAKVVGDRGDLRALLYLDEPLSGRRRSPRELQELADSMQLPLRAVLTTIEREELSQQVRLANVAREVVRAASSRLDYRDLVAETEQHLTAGFRADDLLVDVFAEPRPVPAEDSPVRLPGPLLDAVIEAARRAWETQTVVIVEPGHVWGDEQLDKGFRDELTDHLAARGAGALVLVPIGAGPEPLGMLVLARHQDGVRWTESESSAALDVGHDLGRAILNTRARERELELIQELRRLDEYRSRLISTVSHELKNPLGVIVGHLEMLQAVPDLPPVAWTSLRALGRSSTRLSTVIDDLLLLGRMENPDHPLERVLVDLAPLLSDVVEDGAVAAGNGRVTVAPPVVSGAVVVGGDPEELHRVLANLVSNAVKYTEPGGTVRLRLARDGGTVLFECTDDGIGISVTDREHLFTEFFRSNNPAAVARPGTGLGLTIVQRIVERHGGRIEVESELGAGSTFRVRLPAV